MRRAIATHCRFAVLSFLLLRLASAQAPAGPPPKIGDVTVSASLRTRVESWDWFQGNADNTYTFPGSILRVSLSESRKTFDWQLELAAPILLGLPDGAVAPGSQGQLGFGASYFAANSRSRNAAMIFVKQGFIRFNKLGGADGHSLKLGRMEFIDGTEVTPHDANPGGAEAGPHRAPADRQFQFFGCGPKS